jgi:hypothetical protein
MPTSFQNLIARFFWPQLGPPVFTVESQDVYRLGRTNYCQLNITARLEGQIPADQCAWLVEFVSATHFNPKRPLNLAFPWQRFVSESYLTSGNPEIVRQPGVIIISKGSEPLFWSNLERGRASGSYEACTWLQTPDVPAPAFGASYVTG